MFDQTTSGDISATTFIMLESMAEAIRQIKACFWMLSDE
jgi:hypothetical protein